jgi:hypothetical protein
MFCTNCGEKATGHYCARCGTPVKSSSSISMWASDDDGADWQDECRYQVLIHFPEVRDLIAKHGPPIHKGLTGEDILKICDAFTKPLTGLPIPMSKLTAVVVPIYVRMGLQTSTSRKEFLQAPVGKMLVAAVCSLSRRSRPLKEVHQGENGCVIEATLPPGLRALEGQIVLSIERQDRGTLVDATAKIPGQKFDWGVSKKCIDEIFDDLHVLLN